MAFFMKFREILRSSKSLLKKFEIQLAKSSSLKTPNRALKSQQSLLTFKTTHKHPPENVQHPEVDSRQVRPVSL